MKTTSDRIRLTTIGIWLIAVLASAAAWSEEAATTGEQATDAATTWIDEVVVTARRREENIQDVPIPVTALSGSELDNRSAEDLRDLTRLTPNLDFQGSATASNSAQVFLRGIGQINWSPVQDPKIGVYVDGVYLARPQGAVFDFLDIDRVEVLRGPQGTLFGRNTTAGLIHVVSKRPEEEFDYSVNAGVGNRGQVRASAMLNAPLGDTLSARLAIQHRETDGYVENTATGEDWNSENSQMGRLSLRWEASEKLLADLIVDWQRTREHGSLGHCEWRGPDNGALGLPGFMGVAHVLGVYDEIRDTCNATTRYRSTENGDPDSNVDSVGITLHLDIDLGFATLTSISSWRDMEEYNGSWGLATDTVGGVGYLEVNGTEDNPYEQWSQELRLSGTSFDDRLDWTIGGYIFEEDAINHLDVPLFRGFVPPDCAASALLPYCEELFPGSASTIGGAYYYGVVIGLSRTNAYDVTNGSEALFGEITWRFLDQWTLTAGLRYTWDDRDFRRTEILSSGVPNPMLSCPDGTPPENAIICIASAKFSEWTPRAILGYQPSEQIMLYGGFSRGYSSGGFNQDTAMRPYEPEISDNWEAGIKSTWLDNRLLLNLTAFHNSYENQQITVGRIVNGQPAADLINAQKATLYGVEGEFRAELGAGFYVLGTFGVLGGKYDEFTVLDNLVGPAPAFEQIITERDLSDTELVRGSPYTLTIAVGKHHTFAGGSSLNAQVGWSGRGRTYNTLETLDSSRQKAYGLLDARVVWTLPDGRTSVAVWGANLLDKEYFPSAVDLSATGANTRYWGPPASYAIEITRRFRR